MTPTNPFPQPYAELTGYVCWPLDPERPLHIDPEDWWIGIHLPEGPELIHDAQAGTIYIQGGRVQSVLERTREILFQLGFIGVLFLRCSNDAYDFGSIAMNTPHPKWKLNLKELITFDDCIVSVMMEEGEPLAWTPLREQYEREVIA